MLSKTSNNISIQEIFASIDISLKEAAEIKSFESCQLIAERLVALLKIPEEINKTELLFSNDVLQKPVNNTWTHKAPKYSDRKAYYQLASKNQRNIDFKLFWAKKTNRRTISNLVHRVTSNYEDDELLYADENLGIDFIVPDKADRLIIALSSNYKIRTLELHKALTNTQKQIFEKWYNSPEDTHKKTLHQILWDSFDIHPLNKEFYRNIAELFTREVQHLVTNKILDEYTAKQFTTRLIGRIIFCWFLRKKNIIAEEFNYFEAKSLTATEFYHKKLEILFFDVLNTPQNERNNLDRKTPFLNGGLFEPRKHDYYREKKISFPDDYFIDFFYDFLDKYNFTTDESSSDFQQVAIDPEMLGRIFENLLAEQSNETGEQARKAKGAFYTPREIVDYMCRESLRLYLAEKLGEDSRKEKILNLLLDKKEHEFDYKNDRAELNPYKARLIEALDNLKIIDPACGSGAFPMGILQILVSTYARLDGRLDSYKTKKGIISENIYGVDIEPTAIEISRLRVWLSLVVDIELKNSADNSGIEPLPNLDFKFICANSLIPLKECSHNAEFEKSLKSRQEQYFTSKPSEKKKLQGEFQKLLGRNILNSNRTGISERQQQLESYQPFDSESVCEFFDTHLMFTLDGFDIVIGNPPYIKEYTYKEAFKELKKDSYYQGKMDLWYLFACRFLDLLKANGHQCFIATNNWVTNNGASKLRNKIVSDAKIIEFIDFNNYKIFESADIQTMVYLLKKDSSDDKYKVDVKRVTNASFKSDDLDLFLQACNFDLGEYYHFNFNRLTHFDKIFNFSGNNILEVLEKITLKANFNLSKDEVAQGIVPPQDFLNKKNQKILGDSFSVGDGIFILSQQEKDNLKLTKTEYEIIRPYFTTKELNRYSAIKQNQYWIIYTGSSANKIINNYPNIKNHLDKFAEIITSDNAPYGLHRARNEDFFKGEKIISLRKCPKRPTFTYTNFDAYVAQTFFVIKTNRINLQYLTAILNSKVIQFWLRHKGKMQGNNYQIDKEPLINIPIIKCGSSLIADQVIDKVSTIISKSSSDPVFNIEKIEKQIDEIIYSLYGLSQKDIQVIESTLNSII